MNQKEILSTFCSYHSSKLNRAVQRPGKHYISNLKQYFPAAYAEVKFSQEKEIKRERAQNEAVRSEGRSILQFSKQIYWDAFFCIQNLMQSLITGSHSIFSLLLLSVQRMATVHVMSNYSIAVFSFMLNEWFNTLLAACYLNPALNTELFISCGFSSGTHQFSI